MNIKLMSMFMVGLLSCGMLVGCGNDTEVQYQEPTQQQEEYQAPVDEDLTPQYEQKIGMKEQLKAVESVINYTARENLGSQGLEYKVITDEASNTVMLYIDVRLEDIWADPSGWENLKTIAYNTSVEMKQMTDDYGCNEVNISIGLGDIANERVYFATMNEKIIYDMDNE